jgi:hypothetical protein
VGSPSSRQCFVGVGCVHVLHSGGGVDADEADEVNGIGGVLRLVQGSGQGPTET